MLLLVLLNHFFGLNSNLPEKPGPLLPLGVCVRLVTQSCPNLCDPMDCYPPGSSVRGDSPGENTRVGCHALPQGIFPTQGWTQVSHIAGGVFTSWATREDFGGVFSTKLPLLTLLLSIFWFALVVSQVYRIQLCFIIKSGNILSLWALTLFVFVYWWN